MVRKGQITAFSFDISPIFMFIVLHNHWFALLLQGLKLYPPEAGEFLQWKRTYSAVCVALKILILRTLQKMRLNWSIPLFARTHLSQCVELWNLPSKSQWKLSDFDKRLVRIFFDPCIKNLAVRKCQTCYHFWRIYITELKFLSEFWRLQWETVHFWSWFLVEGDWFIWLLVSEMPYLKFSVLCK